MKSIHCGAESIEQKTQKHRTASNRGRGRTSTETYKYTQNRTANDNKKEMREKIKKQRRNNEQRTSSDAKERRMGEWEENADKPKSFDLATRRRESRRVCFSDYKL